MARKTAKVTQLPAAKADPEKTTEARDRHQGLDTEPPELKCSDAVEDVDRYSTESIDRAFKAHLARFTLGVSPFGLASTFFNWGAHLAGSPGKQVQLAEKAARKSARLTVQQSAALRDPETPPCIEPLEHDDRFEGEDWRRWPYSLMAQNFLLTQQWWYNATNDIDGLSRHDEQVASFVSRQMLDLVSPSNFVWTNPEIARLTLESGGMNLVQGFQNFLEDWEREISGKLPVGAEDYRPGHEVATTEGRVVFRNHLVELLQYRPKTDTVQAEPILIVPAWIMKYYILDLSPDNSLIGYLVDQGFTVFCLSWRNPTADDRDLGMDDYINALTEAMDAVSEIVPEVKMHAVGYCIGGTLLSAKAAQMARDGQDRLQSLTLFATQTDFEEPGELQLFTSESEVSYLENMMWDQGYLDTKQMAGAFQLLKSRDLIWSRYTKEYLRGNRQGMFDLMAWNADATRMPYRMHSEYLRSFYLENALAEGKYRIGENPVAISDIRVPVFCVSTASDHIAPWQSVHKLHLLADTDITFVLTSGGHNAGIVSEPGHEGREYRIRTTPGDARYMSPQAWRQAADRHEGSWWPELVRWLQEKSTGDTKPPKMGGDSPRLAPQEDAPGTYVHQR
mgnify:CR=1 FL=1